MKILILYHIKEREYVICDILREVILENNPQNEVYVEDFDACYRIYLYRPDVIVSTLPRDNLGASLLTFAKYLYGSVIITMPTEGLMSLDEDILEKVIGYGEYDEKLVDYYFFWGKGMAEGMRPLLLRERKVSSADRVKTFGYIPYETKHMSKYAHETALIENLNKIINKYDKVFTFVTGFHNADITLQDRVNEGYFSDKDNIDKDEAQKIETMIRINRKYRDNYMRSVVEGAKQYPNILFIVKLHPVEVENIRLDSKYYYSQYENIPNVFLVKEAIPISIILNITDVFFHYGSTAGMEAYIYRIPMVQLTNEDENKPKDCVGDVFFKSHIMVNAEDTNIVQKVIDSDLVFFRLEETEEILYNLMNYKFDEEYKPAEKLAQFILEEKEAQKLSKENVYFKKILTSEYRSNFIRGLLKNTLLCKYGKQITLRECARILYRTYFWR